MLPEAKVREVRQLLSEKTLSQRRIAKIVGVSRGTVTAIASGKYTQNKRGPASVDDDYFAITGPAARCPGCGGNVYLPCRLCYVRALTEIQRKREQKSHSRDPQAGVCFNRSPKTTSRYLRSCGHVRCVTPCVAKGDS